MKRYLLRIRIEAIFDKEIIINDKNMSDKELKEIIEEHENNFCDEVLNDIENMNNESYENNGADVTTIWNLERR